MPADAGIARSNEVVKLIARAVEIEVTWLRRPMESGKSRYHA